jgi:hypothetical protein
MNRINSILTTSLFLDNRYRRLLVEFLQTRLNVSLATSRTYSSYFDTAKLTLKDDVVKAIRDSRLYIGFEHQANDQTLQTMIFLFLFYSVEKFPDIETWNTFYNQPEDVKYNAVREGIIETWQYFQESMIIDLTN